MKRKRKKCKAIKLKKLKCIVIKSIKRFKLMKYQTITQSLAILYHPPVRTILIEEHLSPIIVQYVQL